MFSSRIITVYLEKTYFAVLYRYLFVSRRQSVTYNIPVKSYIGMDVFHFFYCRNLCSDLFILVLNLSDFTAFILAFQN